MAGGICLPVSVDLGAGEETLKVRLTKVERSLNAYPKYLDLFRDGLDIAVHVGGDHHTPAKDIDHARSIYEDLVAAGFRSPVDGFGSLKIDSGPLTSTIRVKDEDVQVRVRIEHVDMTTPETRDKLVESYRRSMKDADVIIYDGHAGRALGYSGVVFAYQPQRVSIPANEFKDIPSGDKQQIYLFNGCETYGGYADKLYENPKRRPETTDVITTVNFSAIQAKANQVIAFIHALIDEPSGEWVPRSWDNILRRMNDVGERSWVHIYGVHGLDDNPKASPLADPSKVGDACWWQSTCAVRPTACVSAQVGCRAASAEWRAQTPRLVPRARVLPPGATALDEKQCSKN